MIAHLQVQEVRVDYQEAMFPEGETGRHRRSDNVYRAVLSNKYGVLSKDLISVSEIFVFTPEPRFQVGQKVTVTIEVEPE